MKLCLFIGHHKTGSTALQDFLWRNAVALLQAGILYPMVEAEGFACLLRQALGEAGPTPFNAREAHNALAFRLLYEAARHPLPPWHADLPPAAQMLAAIRTQIGLNQPRATILCSEVFANFGAMAPALIGRVASLAPGAEVALFCTLRRPDLYLASWQAQRLRFGHRLPPLSAGGVAAYAETIHLDYARLLAPWVAALPTARPVIRNYADVCAAGGSVQDFCARSGLGFPAGLAPGQRVNAGLHPALMEYARRGNETLAPPDAGVLRDFLFAVSDRIAAPPRSEVELYGQPARDALLRAFAPSAVWLARFGGVEGFFPDLAEAARVLPLPWAEASRAIRAPLLVEMRAAGLPAPLVEFAKTLEIA